MTVRKSDFPDTFRRYTAECGAGKSDDGKHRDDEAGGSYRFQNSDLAKKTMFSDRFL